MDKKGGELFDVTRGAYDGAQDCELARFIIQISVIKQNKQFLSLIRQCASSG